MRKIESQMLQAIRTGKSWELDNTRVHMDGFGNWKVYLFNNLICDKFGGQLSVYTIHQTATTKSRLNAILRTYCDKSIYQKDYIWYYSDNTYTNNARTFFI
jgi:hypothetical protein